ncbi:MAG: dUTP diphosphatase [Candidatus Latescibacteria bacterium]|nr:dUTP diphosphatase [Candidatus Latescibacterota bacterium]
MITVKFIKLKPTLTPVYQTLDASGIDLHAAQNYTLKKGEFKMIDTGIAIEMPKGLEAQVRPRSGLAAKFGIGVLNSPGTIDADYRGEIKVILFNFSKKDFKIKKGDRIAQLVFAKITRVNLKEYKRLSKTKRGHGGFGHTG